jgi:predicted Zn finger-like uncharacterized protein
MNVHCPSCNTVFRVDPAKVPESGVNARCTICSQVLTVTPQGDVITPARAAAVGTPAATPQVAAATPESISRPDTFGPVPGAPVQEPPAPRDQPSIPDLVQPVPAVPSATGERPPPLSADLPRPSLDALPAMPDRAFLLEWTEKPVQSRRPNLHQHHRHHRSRRCLQLRLRQPRR